MQKKESQKSDESAQHKVKQKKKLSGSEQSASGNSEARKYGVI